MTATSSASARQAEMVTDDRPGLAGFPRVRLTHLPTPLEPMNRLAAHLGMPAGSLLVKRDDTTGLAVGGNKARKLEFLCADAINAGADWLITSGGPQSNHARMTAAAAAKLGLGCTLVLDGAEPDAYTGNLVLDHVLGTRIVWGGDADDLAPAIERTAAELTSEGRHPYVVRVGGSTPLGALGYVKAAFEIRDELPDLGVVVLASGSCGTQAGLVAGLGDHARVMGVRVGSATTERIQNLSRETAQLAGLPEPRGEAQLDQAQLGEGYGRHTDACREAIHLAGTLEGLVLDPVYTGKALAGLIAAARDGRLDLGAKTVFLHTGGLPGLLSANHAPWATQRD